MMQSAEERTIFAIEFELYYVLCFLLYSYEYTLHIDQNKITAVCCESNNKEH